MAETAVAPRSHAARVPGVLTAKIPEFQPTAPYLQLSLLDSKSAFSWDPASWVHHLLYSNIHAVAGAGEPSVLGGEAPSMIIVVSNINGHGPSKQVKSEHPRCTIQQILGNVVATLRIVRG